ncbi:MAG: DPP IV N-terminal domain-containing protein, partial [Chitinophagaceae bacterium]|nr:DPP IV N-terminal domain-containing protein [Chitinophagaceae bacterium]
PKGNYIAYYRFDESKVKEYEFTIYDNKYNEQYSYKYPKAGEANSVVEIHIYDVNAGNNVKADYEQGDIYIPRIKWTRDDNTLLVFWMNRHQNDLKLLATNAKDGTAHLVYEEKNKYFVEINDDWWFLKDGKNMLYTSEKDGYRHLYMNSLDGKKSIQLTKGPYEITDVNGIDEDNQRIYYTVAYPTPMDRNVFETDFKGSQPKAITEGSGWHRLVFNKDYSKYFDYYSNLNTPQTVSLYDLIINRGNQFTSKLEKVEGDNDKLKEKLTEYGYGKAEFIRVPNSKGDTLNGWMLKPADFDPSKKYPVLFCNYGGPGSQQVSNRFGAVSAWHQLLAQKGFIVVSIDNT